MNPLLGLWVVGIVVVSAKCIKEGEIVRKVEGRLRQSGEIFSADLLEIVGGGYWTTTADRIRQQVRKEMFWWPFKR